MKTPGSGGILLRTSISSAKGNHLRHLKNQAIEQPAAPARFTQEERRGPVMLSDVKGA